MAGSDNPLGEGPGVSAARLGSMEAVVFGSQRLGRARERYAEAFLRAKISSKNPTDRQAEASAEIEAGQEVVAAETTLFLAKVAYAAAAGAKVTV